MSTKPLQKTYIFWLPIIAQDDLMVVRSDDIYTSCPSAQINTFYFLRSHLTYPESNKGSDKKWLDTKITIWMNIYTSDMEFKNSDTDNDPYCPPRYNKVKEISEQVFNEFQSDFAISPPRKKLKKLSGWVSDIRNNAKVYNKRIRRQGKTYEIQAELKEYLPNGLAKFTVSSDYEYIDNIVADIYRHVKMHFHYDHYHNYAVNLAPPFSGDCDIVSKDNPALLHYIEYFHNILTTSLHTLYQDYQQIDSNPEISSKQKRKQLRIQKLNFYNNCHDILANLYISRLCLTVHKMDVVTLDYNLGIKNTGL